MKSLAQRIIGFVAATAVAAVLAPAAAFADSITLTYQGGNGYVQDSTTSLTVTKLDQFHNYVPGATLAIIDQMGGQTLVTWVTESSSVTFERYLGSTATLDVDRMYVLREVVTPDGYAKASDVSFYLDSQGSVIIVNGAAGTGELAVNAECVSRTSLYLYDQKLDQEIVEYVYQQGSASGADAAGNQGASGTGVKVSPQTGDDAPLVLAGVSTALSLLLIIALQVVKNRLPKKTADTDGSR